MVVPPDPDRLRKVVSRFLVASSLKRSDQPNTPYVSIMGPSVDDVAVVLDAARFLLSVLEPSDELVGKVAKAIRERAGSWLRETNDDWLLDSGAIARAALAALSDKEEE